MHCGELVRLEQALCSATVAKRKVCRLRRPNHSNLVHGRNGMAHARVYRGVHEPLDGLLVHSLQDERLRNGTQDRLLLCLEGDDGLGYPARVNDVPSLAVSCRDVRCDLQGRDAERAQRDRADGNAVDFGKKGGAGVGGFFYASEQRRWG
jgi:hypothetical protein